MTASPYYERNGIVIYHGDCLDVLPALSERDGFVITDPPYNAGKNYGEGTNDRQEWRDWVRWLNQRQRAWQRVAPESLFFLSGTTLRAAQEVGRRAIGIEIEERWCEAAARRLEDYVPGRPEQAQMFGGVGGE